MKNLHPPPDGTYTVTPKSDYKNGDSFVQGTPTIIPLDRIHPESMSKGCLTVPPVWANRLWDTMNQNFANGGTKITYATSPIGYAISAGQEGQNVPAPKNHSWPVFNILGAEPVPQWPTGKGPGIPGYKQY